MHILHCIRFDSGVHVYVDSCQAGVALIHVWFICDVRVVHCLFLYGMYEVYTPLRDGCVFNEYAVYPIFCYSGFLCYGCYYSEPMRVVGESDSLA